MDLAPSTVEFFACWASSEINVFLFASSGKYI
jgi:hypothetical protein